MSENRSYPTNVISALSGALNHVPKLDRVQVSACLTGTSALKLNSKQTTLAVAHINRALASQGLAPITAKELSASFKPTFSGCLEPCDGSNSDQLLGLINQRLGARQ